MFCQVLTIGTCWAQDKPNIVFILIDDLGWTDLGYMGSEYYETPNIDRLANGGMIFTDAYANAANCAPTRASLLSGQYSPRHGVYTVGDPARGNSKDRRLIPIENSRKISLDKITIAEALEPAGYVSAAIGKWHIGNSPSEQGFDFHIDRNEMQVRGHLRENGDYLTDLLTNEAIGFIKRNNPLETRKPFFLYLSHHAVHTPIQAKKEFIGDFDAKPSDGCHNHTTYAAMIKSVDESVARINHTLEELGLSENTIIIFFSDNGGHGTYTCQKPLRGGKGMFYEGGIRVPMFVYWPGTVKGGSQCDVPVISTDFYPTFLHLAGANIPDNYVLDGISIHRLLRGGKVLRRKALYWHFPAYLQSYQGLRDHSRDSIFRTRPVSVIREGRWKLLMFHEEWVLDGGDNEMKDNNSVELYDLKRDLAESVDLSKVRLKKCNKLLQKLMAWQLAVNAPIPLESNQEYLSHHVR